MCFRAAFTDGGLTRGGYWESCEGCLRPLALQTAHLADGPGRRQVDVALLTATLFHVMNDASSDSQGTSLPPRNPHLSLAY